MSKIITYGKDAREKLIKGVDAVANAVSVTLGPKGRNVIVGKTIGSPQIINDGVSIAKEIELKDALENAGAQLIKEVSAKTNDAAGDGTTTSTILAQAIIHEGIKMLEDNHNPIQMKDGINAAAQDVIEAIKKRAVQVDDAKLKQVATVSAGNNEEIGELIAQAIKQVGNDGVVTVEKSNTIGTKLKSAEGMQVDKGYLSPYFVTDAERMECVLDKPYVLCISKKVNLVQDILPAMEHVAKDGRSILIIAEDIEGEALAALVVNVMRKVLRCCAIKAPGFGDTQKNMLRDIAKLTGGTVWEEELGIELSQIGGNFFGKAERVIVKKEETIITVDDTTKEEVAKHVEILKAQYKEEESEYVKEKLQERIAKLAGGVAVIQVGAASEVELEERKLRIEDALNATKAAKEEGIVAGGGHTLLQIQEELKEQEIADTDYGYGYHMLVNALHLPMQQIIENAGKDANEIIEKCLKSDLGYNALTDNYENLLESGVVDPAKVTRCAIENAASVAGMLLTTECAIVDEPSDKDMSPVGPPMMM